jgi:dTDP-4-dehydrorhamnose 3,5-epimerase
MMTKPIKDKQTTTSSGNLIETVPYGVTFHEVPTHVDDRGEVFEMFDLRWDWHKDPLVFAYSFTIRPGIIKGWGLHKKHEDRYLIVHGHIEVVLYDVRPNSPTNGKVFKIYLSERRRRLMNIPANVWHADRNIGDKEAFLVNFPTIPYDHADPDKYRLPLDTDQIPYEFDNPRGW